MNDIGSDLVSGIAPNGTTSVRGMSSDTLEILCVLISILGERLLLLKGDTNLICRFRNYSEDSDGSGNVRDVETDRV